jgi:hypothetical protein
MLRRVHIGWEDSCEPATLTLGCVIQTWWGWATIESNHPEPRPFVDG